jgi:hypothetical protein
MESKKARTIIWSCVVILIVACIVLAVLIASGIGISLIRPFRISTEVGEVSTDSAVSTVPAYTPTGRTEDPETVTPEPTITLPADLAENLTDIESQVMRLRGLSTSQPVVRTLITMQELEDIVANDFFSEYTDEDARQDSVALSVIGLIPEGFDLKRLYTDLYSEQIAGFYDDETKEIYVVQGADFGGSEKLTYAHEFTHVLQDQVYDFENGLGYNEETCEIDSEKCAGLQSLIEGDASLTEILWFQTYATREDYDDLMEMFNNLESPVLDSAPAAIAADLYFPYEKGFAFVQTLYDEGGFAAVDDAFKDPPLSTEQILHPERYQTDEPQQVALPDLDTVLGDGWRLFDQNVMGEWYLFLILNKAYQEDVRLSEREAQEASEGWGGDAYAFYLNEDTDEVVFILDIVWDSSADADEFEDAFISYANLRWGVSPAQIMESPSWSGSQGISVLMRDGNRTLWVMAPSYEVLNPLLTAVQ